MALYTKRNVPAHFPKNIIPASGSKGNKLATSRQHIATAVGGHDDRVAGVSDDVKIATRTKCVPLLMSCKYVLRTPGPEITVVAIASKGETRATVVKSIEE